MKRLSFFREKYQTLCRRAYLTGQALREEHALAITMVVGCLLLAGGLADLTLAQDGGAVTSSPSKIRIEDSRFACAAEALLQLTEGNLGALVMISAGIGTIIAVAFGGYKAAANLLAVAVSAFILRSIVIIFFEFDGAKESCLSGSVNAGQDTPGGGATI